jgi:hypothetical protein
MLRSIIGQARYRILTNMSKAAHGAIACVNVQTYGHAALDCSVLVCCMERRSIVFQGYHEQKIRRTC